jgi:hypothetical protein
MNDTYANCRGGSSLVVLSTRARTVMCEVEIVMRLLAWDDREPWSRAALECALGSYPLDLSDALSNLAVSGVICLSEERVSLSCAARNLMLHLGAEALTVDTPCGVSGSRHETRSCAATFTVLFDGDIRKSRHPWKESDAEK